VELVEQDGRLRRLLPRRVAKRFPHIHHRQPDAVRLLFAQPVIKLVHAGFRAVLSSEPDRASAHQIAHHDAVRVPFADRDFVYTDNLRPGRAGPLQLNAHVLLVQFLDRVPIQVQFPGHILDRGLAAAPADEPGEAFGVERVVGQKVETLAFHLAAAPALNAPHLDVQVHARVGTGQVAYPAHLPVVPAGVHLAASPAHRFFERRTRRITRAFGSPKTPVMVSAGRNPGNAYASQRRLRDVREVAIRRTCQFRRQLQTAERLYWHRVQPCNAPLFTHTIAR